MLFHAKQYAAAAKLLDPVCQAVRKAPEPRIQEDALLGSCLLLINIYFAMNMASKAAGQWNGGGCLYAHARCCETRGRCHM